MTRKNRENRIPPLIIEKRGAYSAGLLQKAIDAGRYAHARIAEDMKLPLGERMPDEERTALNAQVTAGHRAEIALEEHMRKFGP